MPGNLNDGITDESYLLVNRHSVQLPPRIIQMTIKKTCEKAKVALFTIKELRTLSTVQMFAECASAAEVTEQNGSLDKWFLKLEGVIKSIDKVPVRYNH